MPTWDGPTVWAIVEAPTINSFQRSSEVPGIPKGAKYRNAEN